MKNEYDEWFDKAEKDLITAEYNIKGEQLEAGAFFLQQSAEKALKAVYIKLKGELFRTHDLVTLARQLNAPKEIEESCQQLNPAYNYTRYQDAVKNVNLGEIIEELKESAVGVLEWARKKI